MRYKVIETIKREGIIKKGDKILVAVSGGPDSIALLHVLWSLKSSYDLSLYVCHLNHQLRGEDAKNDAEYVETFSSHLGLKSFVFTKNIEAYAKERKMSFEEAAREARYILFESVLKQTGANKIAVGQNMDDQAETFLMRLFRGSGLEGLTAIKFQRDHIIRPLLNIKRDMIEKYCLEHNLLTRQDHTNFEKTYTRNKIRLELLPYIKENFNENVIQKLYDTSQLLKSDLSYIEEHVEVFYRDIPLEHAVMKIPMEKITVLHVAIKSRVLRKIIDFYLGHTKGVGLIHMEALLQLIESAKHGSKTIIQDVVVFEVSYDTLLVYKVEQNKGLQKTILDWDKGYTYLNQRVRILDLPVSNRDRHTVTIDADKIKGKLFLRTRQEGDRFVPLGMKGHKKLSDFFVNLKISVSNRDDILLLCDDENIIWVVGYRMSELYKIDEKTRTRLSIICETSGPSCEQDMS